MIRKKGFFFSLNVTHVLKTYKIWGTELLPLQKMYTILLGLKLRVFPLKFVFHKNDYELVLHEYVSQSLFFYLTKFMFLL